WLTTRSRTSPPRSRSTTRSPTRPATRSRSRTRRRASPPTWRAARLSFR
ncbi:MAG: hypothetical protein AVDCRST_MAG38-3031, partial [uncultured Solirubrobacteraceae bacterium]